MAEPTTTRASKPGAPTNLLAGSPTESTLTLTWTPPSGSVSSWAFEEQSADGTWRQVGTLQGSYRTWVHRNLQQGTAYVYRMRARNAAGWGSYSTSATGTTAGLAPPQPPAAPTSFRTINPTASSLTLAWVAPSGPVSGYAFECRQTDGTWKQVGTLGAGYTNWVHRNLASGSGYTYRMRAANADGYGPYTPEATGVTVGVAQVVGPSGAPMPTADPSGWRRIFGDDFDTDVPLGSFPEMVSERWGAYPYPWPDTTDKGTYDPHRVLSQHDGVLDYWMRTVGDRILCGAPTPKLAPGPNANWGSGLMSIRWAIRFKADSLPCFKTAWLLWPDQGNSLRYGEIDFPEGDLDESIWAFMHRTNATSNGDQDAYRTTATFTSWHTAEMEWVAGDHCTFWMDGITVGDSRNRVPDGRMHAVLQSEVALSGCTPDPSTQGHILIDWAVFWTKDAA